MASLDGIGLLRKYAILVRFFAVVARILRVADLEK